MCVDPFSGSVPENKKQNKEVTPNQEPSLFVHFKEPPLRTGSLANDPSLASNLSLPAASCHSIPPTNCHRSDANRSVAPPPPPKSHRHLGRSSSDCHTGLRIDPLPCFISTLLCRLSATVTRSALGRRSNLLLVHHGPHPSLWLSPQPRKSDLSRPGRLYLRFWCSCRSTECPDPLEKKNRLGL